MLNLGPPRDAVENAFRVFFAGHLARVGGGPLRLETWPVELPAKVVKAKGPEAEWAKRLLAEGRNEDLKIGDILNGMDHYFSVFRQLKRLAPDIYRHFSKVGVPLVTDVHAVYKRHLDEPVVLDAKALPALFGVFFSTPKELYRQRIDDDIKYDRKEEGGQPYWLEFVFFEKLKSGHGTVVSPGTVVYRASQVSLVRRELFSDGELRQNRYGHCRRDWGFNYLLGISPDGVVKALPMHWTRDQRLPSGHMVHHSTFAVPPSLKMGKRTADEVCRGTFNMARAFAAAALAGAEVVMRKDGLAVRVGVPMAAVKEFFADRDGVKKPILHYVAGHERVRKDGKRVKVGEHLRGARAFRWNGCEVMINVVGVHTAAVEGFSAGGHVVGEDEQTPPGYVDFSRVTDIFASELWSGRRSPMRRGYPAVPAQANVVAKGEDGVFGL